ncbi:unnamed protein product [Rotaria sordida]|nr:unnamed protein product [Rotaria sordida]CAF3977362.1 unnamed protein product [Rotaria sordida]
MTEYQIKLNQDIIAEWYWNKPRQELFDQWMQTSNIMNKLKITSLTGIHYNIRYFSLNQLELLQIIKEHQPMITSLNEFGSHIHMKIIEKLLSNYEIIKVEGKNKHGGTVLTIDKTDKDATILWQHLTNTKNDNSIEKPMKNSDLTFSSHDFNIIINSLKNNKSSSFDRISNQMVKLIPIEYYPILINQYSKLFASTRWKQQ